MPETPHSGLVERYRVEPDRARVTVAATTELEEGLRCSVTLRGHTVESDEPRALGGADAAQSPVELLMTSLATCQAITYRVWAAELGVRLDRVEVTATGSIDLRGFLGVDDDTPAGFTSVRLSVALAGPDPAERYRELADAVDRHCPVLDVLSRPVPVEREVALP